MRSLIILTYDIAFYFNLLFPRPTFQLINRQPSVPTTTNAIVVQLRSDTGLKVLEQNLTLELDLTQLSANLTFI